MKLIHKKKNWICILFAIAIIISGMCFEQPIKADSSLCCIDSVDTSKISYVSTVLEKNEDLCTGELLGIYEAKEGIASRSRFKQRNYKTKLVTVQSVVAFLPEYSTCFTEILSRYVRRNMKNSLYDIICFIHHQDGAKGRLSYF